MAVRRKTITLSEQQDAWVKARIESGDYTNDSEYFRDLIRRDQEQLRALKQAIQEGLDSGISERSMSDIWTDVKRSRRAARG